MAQLSNLTSDELEFFTRWWASLSQKRRREIVSRLVEMAEENVELSFDSIFKHGLKDNDEEVQCRALEGLWENEEPSLITPLIDLLEHGASARVQAAAATALGKFARLAEHKNLRPFHASRVQEALLSAVNDETRDSAVRGRALEAAGPMSLPLVIEAIRKAYEGDDQKMRISAVFAMGESCDLAWLPLLKTELANEDPAMRYEAVVSIRKLEDRSTAADLIRMVEDADTEVRLAAVHALGEIGSPDARDFLKRLLRSGDAAVRQAAEQTLTEISEREFTLNF